MTCLRLQVKSLPEAVTQRSGIFICKAGHFSYGESPRTPPLEGTSLHRRNESVERPWGILSLFTTCVFMITSVIALPEAVTHATWPTSELIPHQGALDKMQQVVLTTVGLKKYDVTTKWRNLLQKNLLQKPYGGKLQVKNLLQTPHGGKHQIKNCFSKNTMVKKPIWGK